MSKLFSILLLFIVPIAALAETPLWQDVKENSIVVSGRRETPPKVYRTLRLNTDAMERLLATAPMEFSAAAKTTHVIITLPKADGTLARFEIVESPMVSPSVAAEIPDWKTYSGRGLDDPTATARLSWSKGGFRAYIIGADGAHYVDPYSSGDRSNYIAYRKQDLGQEARGAFHCNFDKMVAENGNAEAKARSSADSVTVPAAPEFSNGTNLRTYRVAIATTGEYTVNRGGQAAALQDVTNAINRINLIYQRDLSIKLMLVSGTATVFPDPATDPYNNTDDPAQLSINTTTLNNAMGGAGNYDIGHLFGTGGGGIAATPCVCSSQKAEGYSARGTPTGDAFWVDYVAHEMGHQFGADHTYNTNENGGCSTRSAQDAYEVGSGATIMSYVGVCSERNLQSNSIDNFHIRSITQIFNAFTSGGTGSCGAVSATSNNVPVAGAGSSFTIPKQTPFTLTATGTDANSDALTFSWEEYDLGPASGPNGVPTGSYDVDTDGTLHPLFRPFAPRSSASRTFPSLPYILNNANTPPLTFTGTSAAGAVCPGGDICVTGESLPSQTRTLNFRVAVRDGKGGISDAGVAINVNAGSGPFVVTAPNTAVSVAGGSQLNVTWNVANTTAAPVSAANVRISLSTDGGNTFPNILVASTANDGSETVTVTDVATTTARIKVEAVGNIFFDISDANFTITSSATPGRVANVSTRLPAGTGDNALIEGFIVTGTAGTTKKIIVRAIGPTLANFGITDAVANPTLEIFDASNTKIASNDDWKTTQVGGIIAGDQFAEINGSGVAPTNDAESAIVANLTPGSFTAVVRGANNTTGTALVDAYDLSAGSAAKVANVATRGLIQPGDKLLIGGFIVQGGSVKAVIRAIGPSLAQFQITNALPDTTLELRDSNGTIVRQNDDWKSDQQAELEATGLQPSNNLEAALVQTIPAGQYSAQVRGKPEATGTGVVEIYFPQ